MSHVHQLIVVPVAGPVPTPPDGRAEEIYLEKVRRLQQYIEPLKRMLNKLEAQPGQCEAQPDQ